MHQEGTKEKQYHEELLRNFEKVMAKNEDPYLHKQKKAKEEKDNGEQKIDIKVRLTQQQILFMQYPMEKKGKNFKTTQVRTFKIEDGRLLQIDKSSSQKELPSPSKITFHEKDNGEWSKNYTDYWFNLELQFPNRTPITIYFKARDQANEIYLYLLTKLNKGKEIYEFLNKKYREKMMYAFLKRFQKVRKTKDYVNVQKKKYKSVQRLQQIFKMPNQIKSLMYQWQRKSAEESQKMDISIELFAILSEYSFQGGFIKLWVGNQTYEKNIYCLKEQKKEAKQFYLTKFEKPSKYCLDNIDTKTVVQFQLQVFMEKSNQRWRSERFYLMDLLKCKNKARKTIVNMSSSNKKSSLCFQILNLNDLNTQSYEVPKMTPIQYPIIRQLYGNVQVQNINEKIHQSYCLTVQNYLQYESSISVSFLLFRKLFDLLNVDTLIQKIYNTHPFNQYINVSQKGTFFYGSLIKKAQRFTYYDSDKLVWKYKCHQLRRFLGAFKSFDETPRINFTEPFYHICKRCVEISMNQSIIKWKTQFFDSTIIGRQSMAFFLVLGLLRVGSSLFLQQQKKIVATNSLLFHYVLKHQLSKIYWKVLKTQLNIEAFFGAHSVSLFAELLSYELFFFVIDIFMQENKENPKSIHHSLIGVMLALIVLVDEYKSCYISAEHYIQFFKHFCTNVLQRQNIQFMKLAKKYQKISASYSMKQSFTVMKQGQQHYHTQNMYNGQLGEISQQLYDEFMCYHFKREADIRKIFMIIDRVELGKETEAITLSLHQNSQKIYEHQFKGVGLDQLRHPIEFKLLRLDKITITLSSKNRNSPLLAYSCELDPKSFPSNYYFQFVSELNPLKLEVYSQKYISYQVYIKDSCEIQYLENSIPQKYISNMLLSEIKSEQNCFQNIKDQILFCNSYIKNFRMRQNNLNLLYGKLGWYGNHYLVPQERVIQIYKEKNERVSNIDNSDEKRLNILKYYSRCIFGKCILPTNQIRAHQNTKFHTQAFKSSTFITHQTTKNQIKEYLQYTSTNNILTYTLDNFYIPINMNFLQFYYKINKNLPLLNYLGYQTLQFYIIPDIYFIVHYLGKTCKIIFSDTHKPIKTKYTKEYILTLEKWAPSSFALPQSIQFSYFNEQILLDQFLYLLKLNILDACYEKYKNSPQNSPSKRINHLPTTLRSKNMQIPNFSLYNLYCIMNETDVNIEFEFVKSSLERLQKTTQFCDFAFINGKWRSVATLIMLESPNYLNYLVEEAETRNKYMMKSTDMILGRREENNRIELGFNKNIQKLKYTDKQLQDTKQCVVTELSRFL